jgi:PKD repeat protein
VYVKEKNIIFAAKIFKYFKLNSNEVMKKINFSILSVAVIGLLVLSFSSCKKETPAPTVTIFASVDGYQVAFTATVTDVDSYAWEFGDGETSSEKDPVHVYAQSGSYTAKLVVTGGGGTADATVDVTIVASKLEMLTGGPAAKNGKSWSFGTVAGSGDGIYKADADFTMEDPIPSGILTFIGLQSEYEDQFIFHNDMSYTHDARNDSVVCNIIYAMLNQIPFRPSAEDAIVLAPFTPAASTFTFTEGTDLKLEVTSDDDKDNTWEVTWSDVDVLEVKGTEFFGLQDFTRKYIVFNIAPDQLQLGIFISATDGSKLNYPSHMIKMTFVSASPK